MTTSQAPRWRIWESLEDQDLSDKPSDTTFGATWPWGESPLVRLQNEAFTATIIYEEL